MDKQQAIADRIWLKGLRTYQLECRRKIIEAWLEGHQRLLFQLCTGGGKSIIIRSILLNLWLKNKKILLVCQDGRIHAQLAEHCLIAGVPPEELGIIKAWRSGEFPLELHKPIQVGMIQSLMTTWEEFKEGLFTFEPDVIIVDEGHHCSCDNNYYELWAQFPNARMLAVTATPARPTGSGFYHPEEKDEHGKKKQRRLLFDKLIIGPAKKDLINQAFLPTCETYFGLTPDLKGVAKKKGKFGEFVVEGENGLENRFNRGAAGAQLRGDIVEKWKEYVFQRFGNAPTMVFGVSVQHIEDIASEFRQNGIQAVALHGKCISKTEQDKRLRQFISGEAVILTLCGMGQEGFDLATLAKSMGLEEISVFCVIKALATNSLVKNSQIDGRIRGIDLMRWDWRGLEALESNNLANQHNQPQCNDVVLGGTVTAPAGSLVLGGVDGIKMALTSSNLVGRIRGVRQAIAQGQLELLKTSLSDPNPQVRSLVEAILENPDFANHGKLLYGVILDCGNNLERHGTYDQEHEWRLDAVKKSKSQFKECPHCKLQAIAKDEEWCPQCGYHFVTNRKKQEVLEGVDDGEGVEIIHDKSAEMVLLDREKWNQYQELIKTRSSSRALDWLVRSGATPAELAIAVKQCRKQDGTTYRKESAFWRWADYQKELHGDAWLPTQQQLDEWCNAFGYSSSYALRLMRKLKEEQVAF